MKPIIITNDFVGPTFSEEEYLSQNQTWLYLWRLQGLDLPLKHCLLYTSPSPRDRQKSRMPSSA